jgi:hypothetical protein
MRSISHTESYVKTVLNNLAKKTEGQRNDGLYDAAFTFGGLVAAKYLSRIEAEEKLKDVAVIVGLSEAEAVATINSGFSAGELLPLEIGDNDSPTPTNDQRADREQRRQAKEKGKRQEARRIIRKLQKNRPDLTYHQNLNGKTGYVKRKWGLTDDTIDMFKVGYCPACPTSSYSDSITIPYYWQGKLINIRHRLSSPNGSGKYRPEMTGLPTALFNADTFLDGGWVILVEGEFKAMVLWQYGLPAVGIPGAKNFGLVKRCIKLFSRAEMVYVALDPDAEQAAIKIGKILVDGGIDARLVILPTKPDDFFVLYGGTAGQFSAYLENGRVI